MTDPETADATYVGPMTTESVRDILEREQPDELIGAKLDAINVAEDRLLFKQAMDRLGLGMAASGTAETLEEALQIHEEIIRGFPVIIRPAFTLGGTGGGIA